MDLKELRKHVEQLDVTVVAFGQWRQVDRTGGVVCGCMISEICNSIKGRIPKTEQEANRILHVKDSMLISDFTSRYDTILCARHETGWGTVYLEEAQEVALQVIDELEAINLQPK